MVVAGRRVHQKGRTVANRVEVGDQDRKKEKEEKKRRGMRKKLKSKRDPKRTCHVAVRYHISENVTALDSCINIMDRKKIRVPI